MRDSVFKGSILKTLFLTAAVNLTMASTTYSTENDYQDSPQFHKGKFRNIHRFSRMDLENGLIVSKQFIFDRHKSASPTDKIPMQTLTREQLLADTSARSLVYRIGHSTLLFNFQGNFWLTDPVFSERASPIQWAGPKRFHPTPITIEDLPEIAGVIISHNHYDHLDKDAIRKLHPKVNQFFTPLGVGGILQEWGVPSSKIVELDWWQEHRSEDINLVATPSQHFSGRGVFDADKTLWCSWVIETPTDKIFFSGDSGYFDGFKEIGNKHGPFDLTLMETGAYNKLWPHVHMMPEESLQAHIDLQGNWLLPIHNTTFDLSLHAWFDPLNRITAAAEENDVQLVTPIIGERLDLDADPIENRWWQGLK